MDVLQEGAVEVVVSGYSFVLTRPGGTGNAYALCAICKAFKKYRNFITCSNLHVVN